MISHVQSEQLFAEALKYIPGGVNSPVRAFRAVGGTPFFVDRAKGAHVFDVDGNEYIDYVGTWGPAILGHAHPKIISAVQKSAEQGTSFGIPNPLEVKMAKLVCEAVPSVQKVRMCNSGTEACMSAIRLARGFTQRDKIIKFDGCYHGHADSLLVKAGSGALTFGNPDSAGVPAAFTQHTIVLPFNDIESVKAAFSANKNQIAGIILEPVPGNAGLYLPKPGYLEFLREITSAHESLLIFDEVMTGFRLSFGGRAEIMDLLAPLGPVYQAGTLSGNPLAMAAGIANLEELQASGAYCKLEELAEQLAAGMREAAKSAKIPVQFNNIGSMFCGYFTDKPVHNLADAVRSDRERFKKYFHGMLNEGIYFAPSQFEAGFISAAHTKDNIEKTVNAATKVMKSLEQ